MLPVLPVCARAGLTGFESPAQEYTQPALTLEQLLIGHASANFVVRAEGDSMRGDGIFSGDLLLVSRAASAVHGDIVLATYNGDLVCKRLDLQRKRLCSSDESQPDYALRELESVQIEGVVTCSIRLHRPLATG